MPGAHDGELPITIRRALEQPITALHLSSTANQSSSFLPDGQSELFIPQVMIGVLVGAATAVLLLIIVLCVCCPWPCAPADNKSKDIESKGNIESICQQ